MAELVSSLVGELMRKISPDGRLKTAQEKRELERALMCAGFSRSRAKQTVGDLFRRQAG